MLFHLLDDERLGSPLAMHPLLAPLPTREQGQYDLKLSWAGLPPKFLRGPNGQSVLGATFFHAEDDADALHRFFVSAVFWSDRLTQWELFHEDELVALGRGPSHESEGEYLGGGINDEKRAVEVRN
jgi:hypothetical protein